MFGRSQEGTRAGDREFGGAFLFAGGLAASALLGYAFNAAMGRRLSPEDFGTFAALLAVFLRAAMAISFRRAERKRTVGTMFPR